MYTLWTHICNKCNSSIVSFSTKANHITSTTYIHTYTIYTHTLCVRDPKTYQQKHSRKKNSKMQYDVRKALYIFINIHKRKPHNYEAATLSHTSQAYWAYRCTLTQFCWSAKTK